MVIKNASNCALCKVRKENGVCPCKDHCINHEFMSMRAYQRHKKEYERKIKEQTPEKIIITRPTVTRKN